MAHLTTIENLKNALASEKATERSGALEQLTIVFDQEVLLEDIRGKDRIWEGIFQSLFQCIIIELENYSRKSGAATASTVLLNRLSAASRTLRWLVERSSEYFGKRAVRSLVTEIPRLVVWHGTLIAAISLDCWKIIRAVLAHPAHRAHIGQDRWIRIAELLCNVTLNKQPTRPLPLPDVSEPFWKEPSVQPSNVRVLGLEDIEQMACLEDLLNSPLAPLCDEHRTGAKLLEAYGAFFADFPFETSTHLPAVAGLSRLLQEIHLSELRSVARFAFASWRCLSGLWTTKTKALKEYLVVTLRILLPHLTNHTAFPTAGPPRQKVEQLLMSSLRQLVHDGDTRFSLGYLRPQSLHLGHQPRVSECDHSGHLLQYPVFRSGRSLTTADAVTWAALELMADVALELSTDTKCRSSSGSPMPEQDTAISSLESSSSSGPGKRVKTVSLPASVNNKRSRATTSQTQTQLSLPPKRRRLDESGSSTGVDLVLECLRKDKSSSSVQRKIRRLWGLQCLLFLISRHWHLLDREVSSSIGTAVNDLLSDDDVEIQALATLAMAALAAESQTQGSQLMLPSWEGLLTLCCRRIHLPTQSREVALLATIIFQRGLVDRNRCLMELRPVLSDLELSAPPAPFDSVCQCFDATLTACAQDVILAKRGLESKIAGWLFQTWSPSFAQSRDAGLRATVAEIDALLALNLLIRCCRMGVALQFGLRSSTLPGCPAIDQMLYERETRAAQAYILKAEISGPQSDRARSGPEVAKQSENEKCLGDQSPIQQKCYEFLYKSVHALGDAWSEATDDVADFAERATEDQVRQGLQAVIVALLFEAKLTIHHIRSEKTLSQAAISLLVVIMAVIASPDRWTVTARASFLVILSPILTSHRIAPWTDIEALIRSSVSPGKAAGVRHEILQGQAKLKQGSSAPSSQLLSAVWEDSSPEHCSSFIQKVQECLAVLCGMTTRTLDSTDNDNWGIVKHAKVDSDALLKPADDFGSERSALEVSVSLCVHGLIEISHHTRQQSRVHHSLLQDFVLDGSLLAVDRVMDAYTHAVASGFVKLSHQTALSIVLRLGTEYFPDYQYEMSERSNLRVLDFLEASLPLWMGDSIHNQELTTNCQDFMLHFVKSLSDCKPASWRTRVRSATVVFELLRRTATAKGWHEEDSSLGCASLAAAIYGLGKDPDTRIRLALASPIARLFDECPPSRLDVLHGEVTKKMIDRPDHFEGLLTRGLTNAYLVVISSSLRANALFYFLEPCFVNTLTNLHATALLRAATASLGFSAPSELFITFASQLTFGMLKSSYDPGQLPYQVLGYSTLSRCLKDAFRPIGSMTIAMAIEEPSFHHALFADLCKSVESSEEQGADEVLPTVLAIELIFAVRSLLAEKEAGEAMPRQAWTFTQARLTEERGSIATPASLQTLLEEKLDQVIVGLLMQFWEADCSVTSSFFSQLEQVDGAAASVYSAILEGRANVAAEVNSHEPVRPHAPAMEVYWAIRSVTKQSDCKDVNWLYHVVFQILASIWKQQLVNDQLRHLQALSLCVAMNGAVIASCPALLRALFDGLRALLKQIDLSANVSGMLALVLDYIVSTEAPFTGLTRGLIEVAEFVEACSSAADERILSAGYGLRTWFQRQLGKILASQSKRQAGLEVLYAYPQDVEGESLPSAWSLEELTSILSADLAIRPTKHYLLSLRKALSKCRDPSEIDTFAHRTVWWLLAGLDNSEHIDAPVAEAVADIFYTLKGRIRAPRATDHHSLGGDDALEMLFIFLDKAESPFAPLKAFVLWQTFQLLRSGDPAMSESTFACLRAVVAQESGVGALLKSWPESIGDEIELIAAFPTEPLPCTETRETMSLPSCEKAVRSFDGWICKVSAALSIMLSSLAEGAYYAQLWPLFSTIPDFARKCFGALLHSALALEQRRGSQRSRKTELCKHFSLVLNDAQADPRIWSAIINANLSLRRHHPVGKNPNPLLCDDWLAIDFLLLARRSVDCRLYTTSLLFIELAREHKPEQYAAEQSSITELLYNIYSNVEDPDSFYGVVNADLRGSLVRRLGHEGEWHRVFELSAADLESETLSSKPKRPGERLVRQDVSASLHEMGFNRLATSLSEAAIESNIRMTDNVDYAVAWRTDAWDLPAPQLSPQRAGTNAGLFAALRAIHRENDPIAISETNANALVAEVQGLAGTGFDSIVQARRITRDVLSLREAKQWRSRAALEDPLSGILSKVSRDDTQGAFDYEDAEQLCSVRLSLLRGARNIAREGQIGDIMEPATEKAVQAEVQLLLGISRAAREQDKYSTAMNAVTTAEKVQALLPVTKRSPGVVPELASVLWAQGEHSIALQALSESLQRLSSEPDNKAERVRKALLLARMGEWRATTRSQQAQIINDDLFDPAYRLVASEDHESAPVCFQWAVFAHEQYMALRDSAEIKQLQVFIDHRTEELRQNQRELEHAKARSSAHTALRQHRLQAEKILRQDLAAMQKHQDSLRVFLRQAFQQYAATLARCDDHEDVVVKLTSLWFENADNVEFNESVASALSTVPSHKFVVLTHQLSSRLSKVSSGGTTSPTQGFQSILAKLMVRMCSKHPFHCLYAIYALRKADRDTPKPQNEPSDSKEHLRGIAAQELWHQVKSTSPHRKRLSAFEQACGAYVEWAELDLKSKFPHHFVGSTIKSGALAFGKESGLLIKQLVNVPVPVATAEIALEPAGHYRDLPTIQRYSDGFTTAGGVHLPKIIDCIASNGKRYTQLFKSRDDLRQDAVMQQIFRLLNQLLRADQKTKKRNLNIRTYIVLPLGPQCGLLEFVGNTFPIGSVLNAVHTKYRVEDELTPSQARSEIAAVGDRSASEKLQKYRQVCAKMPPMFHYYFFENFKMPQTWFAVRLNYTRSVATTSIIGHVLGLGDRHVSNILLDNVTGEVIHIDFGVAFEQGKLLPIPELVPFRLTRDMVDGMGLSGVEGVYRRCSEETLRVLRQHSDVVKTVLEVFKYDPLFAWTSNPVKVLRAQRGEGAADDPQQRLPVGSSRSKRPSTSSTTTSSAVINGPGSMFPSSTADVGLRDTASLSAERAIGTVMSKLSSHLSIEYTVNELIQTATDQGNLSAIFHGWQAAL